MRTYTCPSCDIEVPTPGQCDHCRFEDACEGHTPKRLDNIEFVADIMTFSSFGPMAQLFIMDSIIKAADIVAEMDPVELEKSGKWTFISPGAWVGVAREIKRKMAERNKS